MAAYKFFRYIWRANAILILIAAGVITLAVGYFVISDLGSKSARDREADAGVQVAAPDSKEKLTLGAGEIVAGSSVLRANLFVNSEGKFSSVGSGSHSETRNILFIDPAQNAAHWLLPDNDHVVAETLDVTDVDAKRIIANAFFVEPKGDEPEAFSGRLLLVDGSGNKVVEVSDDVKDVQVAALNAGELVLLFERKRRLVFAAFEPSSLAKKREQEIDIPQLK